MGYNPDIFQLLDLMVPISSSGWTLANAGYRPFRKMT
jgi:hypothetical protein